MGVALEGSAHLDIAILEALQENARTPLSEVGRRVGLMSTPGPSQMLMLPNSAINGLLSGLPNVKWLLGDRGYDADWFREALQDKGIRACIPGRTKRKKPVKYDKRRYKRRNRIEIMFGRLKDWRRVATRYDRCPKVFLSAIALASLVIY